MIIITDCDVGAMSYVWGENKAYNRTVWNACVLFFKNKIMDWPVHFTIYIEFYWDR